MLMCDTIALRLINSFLYNYKGLSMWFFTLLFVKFSFLVICIDYRWSVYNNVWLSQLEIKSLNHCIFCLVNQHYRLKLIWNLYMFINCVQLFYISVFCTFGWFVSYYLKNVKFPHLKHNCTIVLNRKSFYLAYIANIAIHLICC